MPIALNSSFTVYFIIACGGAIGAVSRYWISSSVERFNEGSFPLGTFAVNVLGSFLIGVAFILLVDKAGVSESWRPLIMVGFLGAMTTFSTFSLDALLLFQQGNYNTALVYIAGSVLMCLLAAFLGMQSAKFF